MRQFHERYDLLLTPGVSVPPFEALGAHVDEIDPGFANPEEITTKLWFVGSMTIVASLSAEQLAYMDPSSVASTPFFGFEVRLLTYIRPLIAASI